MNSNSLLNIFINHSLAMINSMKTKQENDKKRILAQWYESSNYPRKKKKQVRKKLQAEWSIACWNPFDYSF